jgi:phospholipid/cholesterol/gamma-HCH transport system substrate-binding protein
VNRVTAVLANRLYLSALGVLMVFVVCVAYLFASVLDQPLTSRPVDVTVHLRSAGGLFEGSAVTYRGVKIGKVTHIEMTADGVDATASITSGTKVPASSLAKVRSLSPVGEQYLDFQPTSAGGPYFTDGSTVAASSTDIPRSLSSTVVALNTVLRQIDDRKLHSLLEELSTGLAGTGDDVGRIVDQGDLVLADLERVWPQTERLLLNSGTALDIGVDQAGDIERLATSSRRLAAFLRSYDPELRRTLHRGPRQLSQLEHLVRDARRVLPDFLSVGVSLTDLFATREPQFRALLARYGTGLGALASTVYGGNLNIQLIMDKDKRCRYDVARRDPRNAQRRPLQEDGRCAASFSTLQRGAAHAPGPVR